MRIHFLCELCKFLLVYQPFFHAQSFETFKVFLHSLLLMPPAATLSLQKLALVCVRKKSEQSLSYLLNLAQFSLCALHRQRWLDFLSFASTQKCQIRHSFFIIDDYIIRKTHAKKTQGVGSNRDPVINKARRSQCLVSSSFISNGVFTPFLSLFYIGRKWVSERKFKTKTELAIKLIGKFASRMSCQDLKNTICLVDGGYTNQLIFSALANHPFLGFIGRFHKGRKVICEDKKEICLKHVLNGLAKEDFQDVMLSDGRTVKAVEIPYQIPNHPNTRIVVIWDDPLADTLEAVRPLVTNIPSLSIENIIEYYGQRWREETYHQFLKEGLGIRSHKLRKLKSLARLLEMNALLYQFLEIYRLRHNFNSVFTAKNHLMGISQKRTLWAITGNQKGRYEHDKMLQKYAA